MSTSRIKIGNLARGQNLVQRNDLARRQNDANKILGPADLAGDKITGGRLLMTTLGGMPRQITAEDIRTFKASASALGRQFHGGVTAQDIIDASRPEDVARARTEVRWSTPARLRNGSVEFVASASPNSPVSRHYVLVQFVDYDKAVAMPATPAVAARWLAREARLKWDCGCGRHTFWYRHLSTVLGANAGRPETGFPKIRNPLLTGLGCKHTIRTMTELQGSPLVIQQIARMVEADRKRLDTPGRMKPQTITVTQAQANRITGNKNVRRIVVRPDQRGANIPPPASAGDIRLALNRYSGKTDMQSQAIARALANLLAHQAGQRGAP